MKIELRSANTGTLIMTATTPAETQEMARLMQVDPEELEWELEKYGICETDDYRATER